MKIHVSILCILLPGMAIAAPSDHQRLVDALTCQAESLEIVRGISDKGSVNFENGIATAIAGYSEPWPVEIVILKEPITIHGATSRLIFSDAEEQLGLFPGASVFGVFEGDYRKVVKGLSLKVNLAKYDWEGVAYTNSQPPEDPMNEDCPQTILLSPIEGSENRFYLGCGWCQG